MAYPPSPDPGQLRPKRAWFWVGGLIIVVGVVGGILGFVLGIVGTVTDTSTDAEFEAGGTAVFQADQANTDSDSWKLYADRDLSSSDVEQNCEVTGPDGQEVGLSAPGYHSESTVNGQTWILVSQLDITETGEYTMECAEEADAGFRVGYGSGFAGSFLGIAGSIVALILGPLLGLGVGITVIVVTAVRRSRHKQRLQAAAFPPGGYGPGHPGHGGYGGPVGKD